MSDKLHTPENPLHSLPGTSVISLKGRDCFAFAQAQFMSDIAALDDGKWHWSGWLTPKGRVIALFALLRHSAEHIDLLVLDADPDALVSSLKRYVFRSKVSLEVRSDLHVAGRFDTPSLARDARLASVAGSLELDMGTPASPRTLQIIPADEAPEEIEEAAQRWRVCDLLHGLPRLDADQREQWTPQQLSLERLRAFSTSKGCYPGQEIVARTHFLGQAKRELVAFQASAACASGAEVECEGRTIGRIVSVAGSTVLAILPIERPDAAMTAGAASLSHVPLLDGLIR